MTTRFTASARTLFSYLIFPSWPVQCPLGLHDTAMGTAMVLRDTATSMTSALKTHAAAMAIAMIAMASVSHGASHGGCIAPLRVDCHSHFFSCSDQLSWTFMPYICDMGPATGFRFQEALP